MCLPGSVTPHSRFRARVHVLPEREGGRHTAFGDRYRPQFYFRTTDVMGVIHLDEKDGRVHPGAEVELTVELGKPVAMTEGLGFAMREGGRTVGAGTVTVLR